MRSRIGFAISAMLVLPGCTFSVIGAGPPVVGSGVTKEERREIAPFTGVVVSSTFEADVTIGPRPSFTLVVEDNLLPLVRAEVEDGRLEVRFAEGKAIRSTKRPKVSIVVPSYDYLSARGASKISARATESAALELECDGASWIELEGLSAQAVDVRAGGASVVSLAGKGKKLTLGLSGASKLLASSATFESAKVEVSGASRGEVQVTGAIEGEVSGASKVEVRGNPSSRTVSTSGASSVSF